MHGGVVAARASERSPPLGKELLGREGARQEQANGRGRAEKATDEPHDKNRQEAVNTGSATPHWLPRLEVHAID